MEFLKELFTEPLSFEAFSKAATEKGFKLADLSKGDYVSKGKLTDLSEKNRTLNEQLTTLNTEMQGLKEQGAGAEEYKAKFEQLQADIAAKEEKAKIELADKELTEAISATFGDKKFTSDYVRNGVIADMKAEIAKAENKGKGYEVIFNDITKDQSGIFESEHPAGQFMSGFGNGNAQFETNTLRAAMGLTPETTK